MPQQTKIFRVFVSSTFNDMKTERRLLRENVFNILEQFCRERGAKFQAIDLRWGVNEESQRNQKTMEICLNEIRRCQQLSPRPNFLILLGDRYGWQPVPPAIPETEMELIRSHLNPDSRKLVQEWYRLDENALPAEYVLQSWGERIKEYKEWEPVEHELRMVIREAAKQANLADEAMIKYAASATHQEILAGALNPPREVVNPESHVLAFSRRLDKLPKGNTAEEYLDMTDGIRDSYCKDQLDKLREALEEKLNNEQQQNFITCPAKLENGVVRLEDEDAFVERALTHLKAIIESELANIVDLDEITQEKQYHRQFAETMTAQFTGRQDTLEHVQNYLEKTTTNRVFSLLGASGAGKTCVMAKAVLQTGERKKDAVIICRFIGANAKSSNLVSLLAGVCGEIASAYGSSLESLSESYQKDKLFDVNVLTELLKKCFSLATAAKPLILFFDALDQLSENDAKTLNWLPRGLPQNVRLIVSALSGWADLLQDTDRYTLPLMPQAEGEKLLNTWLAAQGRRLTEEQRANVLDKFNQISLPLYLKIAFEQARTWQSYEPPVKIADTLDNLIIDFMTALETEHSKPLVTKVVSYLLCGRDNGLTEDELLDMLVFDREYWDFFLENSHPNHRREVEEAKTLPISVWSRLFLDLAPYMTERDSYGERLLGFYHRQFNEILKQHYAADEKPIHCKLGNYLISRPLFFDGDAQKQPNVRKCVEQPWQLTQAEMWDEVTETLCDLDFIQAKAVVKMTYDLVNEFNAALEVIPDNSKRARQEKERQARLEKYTRDLIAYAKGEITSLDVPKSVTPWPQEKIDAEIERIRTNPNRADRLRDFLNLLGEEANNLQNYAADFSRFAHQQALNHADVGPVGQTAEQLAPTERSRLLLRSYAERPSWNPLPVALKRLTGHNREVRSVSVTPDGRRAISGSADDSTLIVWDLETGQALKTLTGHNSGVTAASVTPDGRRAVSGSWDTTLIVWDLETGHALKTLTGHNRQVNSVSVTPDGRRAVSGSEDGTLIVWDLETGQALKIHTGHTRGVTAVSVTPDGRRAVSGSEDGTLIVWDLETGHALKTLTGHNRQVNSVSVTPDGRRAVSGSWDTTLIVWDLETGQALKTLTGHTRGVKAMSVTPDGRRAVSGSWDRTLIVWDLETGQALKTLTGLMAPVVAVSVTPDGRRAVSGSWDRTLIVWDLETGQALKTLTGHKGPVNCVCVTPDGRRAVFDTVDDDSTLIVWDLETGQALKRLTGHTSGVKAMSVTPDGRRAVSGSWDTTLIVWDLETGQALKTLTGHTRGVTAVSMTPDGRRAVSGSEDGTLIVWDLETGQALKTLTGHNSGVTAASVTPDGWRAVSGSEDGTLIVWDLETGQALKRLTGHTRGVKAMSVTPDGWRIVSGSEDGTLIVWDLESGHRMARLTGKSEISAVAVFTGGAAIGYTSGEFVIPKTGRELLFPDPGVVTARKIWAFERRQYLDLSVDCPFCGKRFEPQKKIFDTIRGILHNSGIRPEDSPCLKLPAEAWEEPGLLSSCPSCGEALKFNPFIVGGE